MTPCSHLPVGSLKLSWMGNKKGSQPKKEEQKKVRGEEEKKMRKRRESGEVPGQEAWIVE